MRRLLFYSFFCYCLLAHINILGQTLPTSNPARQPSDELSIDELEYALNHQFTKIVSGTSFSTFGNFASVTTADETIKASFSLLSRDNGVFTARLFGGASEGVVAFFQNGELNSKVGGSLSYHTLLRHTKSEVSRSVFARDSLRKEAEKVSNKYTSDSLTIVHKKYLLDANAQHDKLKAKKAKIDEALRKLEVGLNAGLAPATQKHKKDSLHYEQARVLLDMEENARIIKKISTEEFHLEQEVLAKIARDEAMEKIDKKVKGLSVQSLNIMWLSFGYGAKKEDFKLFDAASDFVNQVVETDYVSHEVSLAVSGYKWKSYTPNDRFWSAGINFEVTNNLGALTSAEVVDTREISQDPLREEVKRQSVFTGSYEEELMGFTAFFDYYRFFRRGTSESGSLALHLNPEFLAMQNTSAVFSLHSGVVLVFKKQGEETSVVNLEIFYRLNDLFNALDNEKSLLGRNTIGLQATFPISFLPTK